MKTSAKPETRDPGTVSAAAARRIALAAQGFAKPRPERPPSRRQIVELVRRLGVLQLDSVNVLCRSHYLPVFSRLGPYDQRLLDDAAVHSSAPAGRRASAARRQLVEYWAHEASLIPVELHPLLRWRMSGVDEYAWGSIARIARDEPDLVERVLGLVSEAGPIRASATGIPRPSREDGEMWNWHSGKRALEHLFFTGRVSAGARVNFERLYDLTERVLPPAVMATATPADADAQRELVRVAARALGIAAEPDLGDYFRLPRAVSKARVAELVQSGELVPVTVDGWRAPAYLWHQARRPRRVAARALLSPFDSLIWFRPRTERLFGFTFRLEIYIPPPKRVHGYYVLPFLLGDRLVARVDLKADRPAGTLLVRGGYGEAGIDPGQVASALAGELRSLAGWLGLPEVRVEPRGDLAGQLSLAVRAA